MTNKFELQASARSTIGKGIARRMRRQQDLMPAVIYGGDSNPVLINMVHNDVVTALKNESFFSHILTIQLENTQEQVIIKEIQRHPYKNLIMHMDFQRVKTNEEIHMNVPLHIIGAEDCPGVKAGGVISHNMNEVEIKCLAKDLPEYINVDVSTLNLDESIHLSQLDIPKTLQIVALTHGENHDFAVVSVHQIKQQPVAETAATNESDETTNEDS